MKDDLFKNIKFVAEVPLEKVFFNKSSFEYAYGRINLKIYIVPSEPFGFMFINGMIYWFSYFMEIEDIVSIICLKNFDDVISKIDVNISREILFNLDVFKNSISLDSIDKT